MLDLEITPEKSISTEKWQIILGMSIYQVIQILKANVESIKTVQLIYNDKDPLSCDYMINMINDGIILYFDSYNQRLKLIEISDLKKSKLRFCGNYFNNLPAVQPTIDQINDTFGITQPGEYDTNSGLFLLHFPGLLFTFNIDYHRVEPKLTHGIQSLHFPAGQAPLVSKISIYYGNSPASAIAPEIPTNCLNKDIFTTKLSVIRENKCTKSIQLNLFMQGIEKSYQLDNRELLDVEISFDDTCQDVLSLIGSPTSIYFKSEESSKLYQNENLLSQNLQQLNNPYDYFYNYVTLGLDILFSADTHRISKFVLHSNYPCHYNFNSYFMCNFEILLSDKSQQFLITPSTKWEKIQEYLNIKTPPAILHRSSSTNSVNPFGPTFCYLYEDIIFEIMANGHIASITLFNKKKLSH